MSEEKAKQIAELNDRFRADFYVPNFGPRAVPMGGTGPRIVEITDEDESLAIAFVPVYPATAAMIMITMNNKQQG